MARLELTRHLHELFPDLEGKELRVEATTVAEVVREMERIAPGFAFYVCDERGRLRRHVNIFVEGERISDRERLTDRVQADSLVLVMQALSGG
jgi:sulfur-carrier protein